jgi:hypothetical protein
MQINSFLVKHLKLSHQQIKEDINLGYVLIDDEIAVQKQSIGTNHTIKYKETSNSNWETIFLLCLQQTGRSGEYFKFRHLK